MYVVVKLDPLPVAGLPPGALQLKVQGGVPPEHVAWKVTAVPTVPVLGPVTVTVRIPPTVWVAVAVFALESVVVRVTVKGPAVVYVWLTGLPVPVVPSPKFHAKVYGPVPPVAVAVKVVGDPGVTVVGLKLKSVVKASGLMTMVADAVAVLALPSVAVTETV